MAFVPLHARRCPSDDQYHGIDTRQAGVKNKQQEIFVVADSHTIVHPGTKMKVSNEEMMNSSEEQLIYALTSGDPSLLYIGCKHCNGVLGGA